MAYITPHHVWEFQTARFCVRLYAEPEEMDPADSFEFDEDIEAVRSGEVEWFCAVVRVYLKSDSHVWREVGSDVLGGCAYNSVYEFFTSHHTSSADGRNTLAMKAKNTCICHYFPDMVRSAIAEARATCSQLRAA